MISSLDYSTIDYLRTFKFCVENNIIKRNRKMPRESESASSLLVREAIKSLSNEKIISNIKGKKNLFLVKYSEEYINIFSKLTNKNHIFYERIGKEKTDEIKAKLSKLTQYSTPFITYNNGYYNISMSNSSGNFGVYNISRMLNPQSVRPNMDIFSCINECVALFELVNSLAPELKTFLEEEEKLESVREEEEKELKRLRRARERKILELGIEELNPDDELLKAVPVSRITPVSEVPIQAQTTPQPVAQPAVQKTAQELFNEAATKFARR